MKNTDDAVNFITTTLKGIFNGDYTDVTEVQLFSHYAESILISLLNARRIRMLENRDVSAVLQQMVGLGLLSNNITAFWEEHGNIIRNALRFDANAEWDNPHSIHEGLLGRELNNSGKDVWFSPGKISRDTTGSYYTPGNLAIEVVHEAVEKFLNVHGVNTKPEAARLLAKTKFADLSCGCGEFIKAVQKYLYEQYGISFQSSCMNLYGIDIDPIALQVTICDLLKVADKKNWREIIGHFALGNPLINQPNEKGIEEKTRLFATGRYYAFDIGIDMRHLFGNAHIDAVVGNPPWEKVRFEERKIFKSLMPEISGISQKNKRQAAIEKLKKCAPSCYDWYQQIAIDYACYKSVARRHPFISKSLNGELNTYVLFTELSLNLIDEDGILTLIVKSAIVTSPANKPFFHQVAEHKNLVSICLYDNVLRIFNIDSREKFCVITCTKKPNNTFELIAGARKIEDLHSLERSTLSEKDVEIINPNTLMIPNISKNTDVEVLLDAHRRLPLFDTVYPECHFGRLVHLTAHARYINTSATNDNEAIYEGKFIERYDARFATFTGLPDAQKYSAKAHAKKNPSSGRGKPLPESRYYILKDFWGKLSAKYNEPYMLCWRSLTSTTNARTTLAMILPTMPTCQSIQFLQTSSAKDLLIILALFNSKPFDYLVRLKMPGIDLTQSVIKQIPVPCRDAYQQQIEYSGITQTLERHVLERTAAILSQEPMLSALLRGFEPPSASVRKKSKPALEKELDDLLSIAYGLDETESYVIRASFKN